MRKLLIVCFSSLLLMLGPLATAESKLTSKEEYIHKGKQYPPILFVTNIKNQNFKEQIEAYGAFTKLDEEAIGLPIGIRVLKGHRTKADGAQFSTLMLSASTLGIIPVVSNTEFKVRYEVFVQGKRIAKYEYQVDSTDVENLWAKQHDSERSTTPAEDLFIQASISKFLSELESTEEAQAAFEEYWKYFPPS